jgi:type IV pilus assembly protein PilA
MLKTMRKANIKGFSLVELMVVVAIIGILAAVAIPNFQRFQRRSRQAEGKNILGSIHQAETVFFQEWDTFFGDLQEILVPQPVGTIFYNAGFDALGQTAAQLIANTTNFPKVAGSINTGSFNLTTYCFGQCVQAAIGAAGMAGFSSTAFTGDVSPNNATGNAASFTAAARAWIGGQAEDEWTITNAKVLMQTSDGVQ